MKISLPNAPAYQIYKDDETALRAIRDAGFDGIDCSLDELTGAERERILGENRLVYAESMRKHLEKLGLSCEQAHAPYSMTAFVSDFSDNDEFYGDIVRSIEVAAKIGAPYIVVHGILGCPADMDYFEHNVRFYRSLEPYAEKFGIKIAIENLCLLDKNRGVYNAERCFGNPHELARIVDLLGRKNFTVCFDVGHAAIDGIDPSYAIRVLGDRISCLHVHDNNHLRDQHAYPYCGMLNWNEITTALRDIHYSGTLSLEPVMFRFPAEIFPAALTFAAKIAHHLTTLIEQ